MKAGLLRARTRGSQLPKETSTGPGDPAPAPAPAPARRLPAHGCVTTRAQSPRMRTRGAGPSGGRSLPRRGTGGVAGRTTSADASWKATKAAGGRAEAPRLSRLYSEPAPNTPLTPQVDSSRTVMSKEVVALADYTRAGVLGPPEGRGPATPLCPPPRPADRTRQSPHVTPKPSPPEGPLGRTALTQPCGPAGSTRRGRPEATVPGKQGQVQFLFPTPCGRGQGTRLPSTQAGPALGTASGPRLGMRPAGRWL